MLIEAAIAQLGERQTEDLKVPGSIPGLGIFFRLEGGWGACWPSGGMFFFATRSVRRFDIGDAGSRSPNEA